MQGLVTIAVQGLASILSDSLSKPANYRAWGSNMDVLNQALLKTLQLFQKRLLVPNYAVGAINLDNLATMGCRNRCSGSCDGSCAGSCDDSCSGSCDGSCTGGCSYTNS